MASGEGCVKSELENGEMEIENEQEIDSSSEELDRERTRSLIEINENVNLEWLPAVFGLISASSTSVCGYVTSEDELETVLHYHEIYTQSRFHRDGDDQKKRQKRPRRFFYGSRLLELSNLLTSNDRCRVYLCKYGMRLKSPRENKVEDCDVKSKKSLLPPPKCPARIYVNEVSVYTDYDVSGLNIKERQDKLNSLKRDIIEKSYTLNVDKYYHIRLPLKPAHIGHDFELPVQCHEIQNVNNDEILHHQAEKALPSIFYSDSTSGNDCEVPIVSPITFSDTDCHMKKYATRTSKTHPLILEKIHELTISGITSARAQKIILREFAEENFIHGGEIDKSRNTSYYFPSESTIFNKIKSILYKTKRTKKQCLDKQYPVKKKVEEPILRIFINTSKTLIPEENNTVNI